MKLFMKVCAVFCIVVGIGIVNAFGNELILEQDNTNKSKSELYIMFGSLDKISSLYAGKHYTPIVNHTGTHLCKEDDHCGSGHKCCSGHCKMVDTCP